MTIYGPVYPGSVVSDSSDGGVAWNNPEKAKVEDAAGFAGQTYSTFPSGGKSAYLKATGFDFAAILDGATLLGVLVEWKKRCIAPKVCTDDASRLVKAGVIDGVDHSAPGNWPLSLAWVGYGGSANTLGLTVADIKNSGFGAALATKATTEDGGQSSVDVVRITVWTA